MQTLYKPLPPKLKLPVLVIGLVLITILLVFLKNLGLSSFYLIITGLFLVAFVLGAYFQRHKDGP